MYYYNKTITFEYSCKYCKNKTERLFADDRVNGFYCNTCKTMFQVFSDGSLDFAIFKNKVLNYIITTFSFKNKTYIELVHKDSKKRIIINESNGYDFTLESIEIFLKRKVKLLSIS